MRCTIIYSFVFSVLIPGFYFVYQDGVNLSDTNLLFEPNHFNSYGMKPYNTRRKVRCKFFFYNNEFRSELLFFNVHFILINLFITGLISVLTKFFCAF